MQPSTKGKNPNRGNKSYSRYEPEIVGSKLKYWPENKSGLYLEIDIPKNLSIIHDNDGWWF